jgi:hypothetical protein
LEREARAGKKEGRVLINSAAQKGMASGDWVEGVSPVGLTTSKGGIAGWSIFKSGRLRSGFSRNRDYPRFPQCGTSSGASPFKKRRELSE